MKEDIKALLETICERAQYAECDLIFIETIANKYGFTIDEDLSIEEVQKHSSN